MKLNRFCGKFCGYFWRCINRHEGECVGFAEPEEDDEQEEMMDRLAY